MCEILAYGSDFFQSIPFGQFSYFVVHGNPAHKRQSVRVGDDERAYF